MVEKFFNQHRFLPRKSNVSGRDLREEAEIVHTGWNWFHPGLI